MKKALFGVLLVVLLLAVIVPVYAKAKDPVGERVKVLNSSGNVTVSGPFYVMHGHRAIPSEDKAIGKFRYTLAIDGVVQKGKLVISKYVDSEGVEYQQRMWLFNFPNGLPQGEYTFWSDPKKVDT